MSWVLKNVRRGPSLEESCERAKVFSQTEGCMVQRREAGNIQGCIGNDKWVGVPGALVLGTRNARR